MKKIKSIFKFSIFTVMFILFIKIGYIAITAMTNYMIP